MIHVRYEETRDGRWRWKVFSDRGASRSPLAQGHLRGYPRLLDAQRAFGSVYRLFESDAMIRTEEIPAEPPAAPAPVESEEEE